MDELLMTLFDASPSISLSKLTAGFSRTAPHIPTSLLADIIRFTVVPWDSKTINTNAPLADADAIQVDRAVLQAWLLRFGAGALLASIDTAATLFVPASEAAETTVSGYVTVPRETDTGAPGSSSEQRVLVKWYHGLTSASATEASAVLKDKPVGSFFVRVSASEAGCFTVTYVTAEGVRHVRIQRVSGGFIPSGITTPFPTLHAVIANFPKMFSLPVASKLHMLSLATANATKSPAPPSSPALLTKTSSSGEKVAYDVMLSYQWDEQPTVRRICAALREKGYNVWMDETHMAATYVASMVDAVQNSKCIAICATTKYTASGNCTTECSLAYECRMDKAIVILNLEPGFYPGRTSHVLAALAAGKLYCNFQRAKESEENFQQGMSELLKQLSAAGILPSSTPIPTPRASPTTTPAPPAATTTTTTTTTSDATSHASRAAADNAYGAICHENPYASFTPANVSTMPATSTATEAVTTHADAYGTVPAMTDAGAYGAVATDNPYGSVPADAYGSV